MPRFAYPSVQKTSAHGSAELMQRLHTQAQDFFQRYHAAVAQYEGAASAKGLPAPMPGRSDSVLHALVQQHAGELDTLRRHMEKESSTAIAAFHEDNIALTEQLALAHQNHDLLLRRVAACEQRASAAAALKSEQSEHLESVTNMLAEAQAKLGTATAALTCEQEARAEAQAKLGTATATLTCEQEAHAEAQAKLGTATAALTSEQEAHAEAHAKLGTATAALNREQDAHNVTLLQLQEKVQLHEQLRAGTSKLQRRVAQIEEEQATLQSILGRERSRSGQDAAVLAAELLGCERGIAALGSTQQRLGMEMTTLQCEVRFEEKMRADLTTTQRGWNAKLVSTQQRLSSELTILQTELQTEEAMRTFCATTVPRAAKLDNRLTPLNTLDEAPSDALVLPMTPTVSDDRTIGQSSTMVTDVERPTMKASARSPPLATSGEEQVGCDDEEESMTSSMSDGNATTAEEAWQTARRPSTQSPIASLLRCHSTAGPSSHCLPAMPEMLATAALSHFLPAMPQLRPEPLATSASHTIIRSASSRVLPSLRLEPPIHQPPQARRPPSLILHPVPPQAPCPPPSLYQYQPLETPPGGALAEASLTRPPHNTVERGMAGAPANDAARARPGASHPWPADRGGSLLSRKPAATATAPPVSLKAAAFRIPTRANLVAQPLPADLPVFLGPSATTPAAFATTIAQAPATAAATITLAPAPTADARAPLPTQQAPTGSPGGITQAPETAYQGQVHGELKATTPSLTMPPMHFQHPRPNLALPSPQVLVSLVSAPPSVATARRSASAPPPPASLSANAPPPPLASLSASAAPLGKRTSTPAPRNVTTQRRRVSSSVPTALQAAARACGLDDVLALLDPSSKKDVRTRIEVAAGRGSIAEGTPRHPLTSPSWCSFPKLRTEVDSERRPAVSKETTKSSQVKSSLEVTNEHSDTLQRHPVERTRTEQSDRRRQRSRGSGDEAPPAKKKVLVAQYDLFGD